MKLWNAVVGSALAVALCLAATQMGRACDPTKKATATGDQTEVAHSGCAAKKAACSASKTCTMSDQFPTMVRMAGDEVISCPMAAQKMKDAGTKIVFLVGDKKFESEPEATQALADASGRYMSRFLSIGCVVDGQVKYCDEGKDGKSCSEKKSGCAKSASVSKTCDKAAKTAGSTKTCDKAAKTADASKTCNKAGKGADSAKSEGCCKAGKNVKYLVAGRQFDTWDAAVSARDQAVAAAKAVSMKYIVEGKEVSCSSQVCPIAKASGKVEYVVGDQKLKCEYKARAELAHAQYEAAKGQTAKTVASL